jgi:hypothetical protein
VIYSKLVAVEGVTAVLALVQVTQVKIGPAETHTTFVVEVVFGNCYSRIVNGQVAAASNMLFVFFQNRYSFQEHELDSMLPIDDAQRQD